MSDLTLPLIGLTTLVGYFFSKDGKNPRQKEELRQNVEAIDKPNGKNIYTSNIVEESNKEILERSLGNYKMAETPSETGFIPPLFNTYSIVGNKSIMSPISNFKDNMTGLSSKQLGELNDINRLGIKTDRDQIEQKPMFKSLEKYLVSEEFKNYSDVGNNSDINHLTGLPFTKDHNNMVPFFGGSVKQNIETFSNESLLENRSGKMATFQHKKEINSLYDKKPENIYGNPTFTTQVETDRYIPSLYRQNEKPVEQEYIAAPIEGSIDNPLNPRLTAKTVDELRVINNPKQSYQGRTISGQFGNVRGIQGEVEKRRPDTYYEQATPDNLFRGPGAYTEHSMEKDYETNFKGSSRQDYNMEYYGVASNNQFNKTKQRLGTIDNSSELSLSLFQDPRRQNFENDYIRNISGNKQVDDYGKSGMTQYESERATTGDKSYVLNVQKSDFGVTVRPQDKIKSTIKETTLLRDNSGHVKTSFDRGKIEAYETGLTNIDAKATQKQTLVDNKYVGQVEKERGMGYLVNKFDAKATLKQGLHVDYKGNINFNGKEESRHKYSNVDIRDNKQEVLMGQRPSGPQFFQTASGKVSQGEIKSTYNMLLKEEQDKRDKLNISTAQVISNKEIIGKLVKYKKDDGREDIITSQRLDPIILNQLTENPFVINK